jgi:anti-anti-sigma factor
MIQASPFEMRSERQADSARLILAGELDIATAPEVDQAVRGMLSDGVRDLIVDLHDLRFIDSSGLRLLILLNERATAEDWSLKLIRPSDRSLSVFQITGADENLPFVEEPSAP